jgi:hypothetical protein
MTQFDFLQIQKWLKTFPENVEQALSTCPKCRYEIDKAWRHCANCGFRLSRDIRCKKCKRNFGVDNAIVVVGYEWADYNGGHLSESESTVDFCVRCNAYFHSNCRKKSLCCDLGPASHWA